MLAPRVATGVGLRMVPLLLAWNLMLVSLSEPDSLSRTPRVVAAAGSEAARGRSISRVGTWRRSCVDATGGSGLPD